MARQSDSMGSTNRRFALSSIATTSVTSESSMRVTATGRQHVKLDSETRITTLTIGTALVVAFVRHGLETKWASWEGVGQLLTGWLIHTIALYFLFFGAGFAISQWHKFFLGDERDPIVHRLEFQYYIITTVLVAAVAIGVLSAAGPFSGSGDY
jgi:hypothetical protein